MPFRNLFPKSFEQTKKVVEKFDRKNLTDVNLIGQASELGKSFEIQKSNTPLNAADKILVENAEKTLPDIVSPQLLL